MYVLSLLAVEQKELKDEVVTMEYRDNGESFIQRWACVDRTVREKSNPSLKFAARPHFPAIFINRFEMTCLAEVLIKIPHLVMTAY